LKNTLTILTAIVGDCLTLFLRFFIRKKKMDDTVNEIFEEGAIDPDLYPDQVGYVPLLPFWEGVSHL
jgi:hypothetical protein